MSYGCYNKPRPTTESKYTAQKGWSGTFYDPNGNTYKAPLYTEIKSTFGTTTCQYDKSATDTSCKGCQWAKTE